MIRKSFFYVFLIVLAIALFVNPDLKAIAAGIAILLFGMIMLEEGFRVFAKGPLRSILKKTTDRLYKAITTGALVTALIQSSSLVSVVAISFISAGLIPLSGGIGLIFGANIGTTATSWLVAGFGLKLKISALAMPMLVFGVIFSLQKKIGLRGLGNILSGLGFFFLGIHYMKEGFEVFKQYLDLTQYAIPGFAGIAVYTFVGVIITTIFQSSSATMALILTALAAGQVEYENALSLAIGANIGTTITAAIGSISSNIDGKRLAGAHFIFNLITGLLALTFIYPLGKLVNSMAVWFGISADDYTLKLALFHTIFNVLGVLFMLPLIKRIERFLMRFVKEKEDKDIDKPKYLNKSILKFPETAVTALTQESAYLFENALFEIVTHALNIHRSAIKSDLKASEIVRRSTMDLNVDVRALYYSKVKTIYGEIISYASTAQASPEMDKGIRKRIADIIVANRKMVEIIKAVFEIGKNISLFLESENRYIVREYDKFRKKIIKVLRTIYKFRTHQDQDIYYAQLVALKEAAKKDKYHTNNSINTLIRNNLITPEMASSLVNDKDNLNQIIKNLISVAELLYGQKDSLLENGK
ncbi:Na/Pi cotransporter family protein [Robertkochia marina]|uniref:Na/Pi cotransporter family protein n=1 Tax=Robertkochia marina TaxID=1227945 RepID=A0A4S3LYP5_9FLAO|nr:Na/Pi symporter [Robertkochia marina]THD66719.1 Na/Pi cotransporter family protein [Robertkochia marina]TRZ42392.1 Na/Pi cotransporter family protein [Robertkochia marina]